MGQLGACCCYGSQRVCRHRYFLSRGRCIRTSTLNRTSCESYSSSSIEMVKLLVSTRISRVSRYAEFRRLQDPGYKSHASHTADSTRNIAPSRPQSPRKHHPHLFYRSTETEPDRSNLRSQQSRCICINTWFRHSRAQAGYQGCRGCAWLDQDSIIPR